MPSNDENVIEGESFERNLNIPLGDIFLNALKMHADRILQIDAYTGETLTATLMLNRSILLARWLQTNGFKPGDFMSISSENRLEFSTVIMAGFLTGISLAPLNPEYVAGEIDHVLGLSRPRLLFCSPKTYNSFKTKRPNYVEKIVLFGDTDPGRTDVVLYRNIVSSARSDCADETFEAVEVNPQETTAVVLCSSGTTGLPKGVMTTHSNITFLMEMYQCMRKDVGDLANKIVTGLAPLFHGFGFMMLLMTVVGGSRMIVYSSFNPKLFLESLSKYRVTTLAVPPPVISFIVKHPLAKSFDLSTIKEIQCGAASLSAQLEQDAQRKVNAPTIRQNYGMTELTLTVLTPHKVYKAGSVGQIVPGMQCKVIDETGKAVGPNQTGELCFRGPMVMKGYIGNPQATAETIDAQGWLHTGDVSYYDDDMTFFIVDRIKELIKYNGFQVAPAELEGVLLSHPEVMDAAVVGLQDDMAGELPLAYVVKEPRSKVTAQELEKFVAGKVSRMKRLRGGVHFIDVIPKNPTGKILRRKLREKANALKSKL